MGNDSFTSKISNKCFPHVLSEKNVVTSKKKNKRHELHHLKIQRSRSHGSHLSNSIFFGWLRNGTPVDEGGSKGLSGVESVNVVGSDHQSMVAEILWHSVDFQGGLLVLSRVYHAC